MNLFYFQVLGAAYRQRCYVTVGISAATGKMRDVNVHLHNLTVF